MAEGSWSCVRLRDEVLPEHGIHLEDRAAGGSICRYMTPAEQEQVHLASLLPFKRSILTKPDPCSLRKYEVELYRLVTCSPNSAKEALHSRTFLEEVVT